MRLTTAGLCLQVLLCSVRRMTRTPHGTNLKLLLNICDVIIIVKVKKVNRRRVWAETLAQKFCFCSCLLPPPLPCLTALRPRAPLPHAPLWSSALLLGRPSPCAPCFAFRVSCPHSAATHLHILYFLIVPHLHFIMKTN